ncbi:hypothetical protein Bbelb_417600 [Branchiostoma belcheri]|nr:hypothetical protein Bbelb_417600 [Branchiostoma belcheri]
MSSPYPERHADNLIGRHMFEGRRLAWVCTSEPVRVDNAPSTGEIPGISRYGTFPISESVVVSTSLELLRGHVAATTCARTRVLQTSMICSVRDHFQNRFNSRVKTFSVAVESPETAHVPLAETLLWTPFFKRELLRQHASYHSRVDPVLLIEYHKLGKKIPRVFQESGSVGQTSPLLT